MYMYTHYVFVMSQYKIYLLIPITKQCSTRNHQTLVYSYLYMYSNASTCTSVLSAYASNNVVVILVNECLELSNAN